jgi:hypothetical protein
MNPYLRSERRIANQDSHFAIAQLPSHLTDIITIITIIIIRVEIVSECAGDPE